MAQKKLKTPLYSFSQPVLGQLPPELRNIIYRLLLKFDTPVKVTSPQSILINRRSRERLTWHNSAILRVNRQTYNEASLVFYSENKFIIGNAIYKSKLYPSIHGLKQFIARVPDRHLQAISCVEMECYFHPSLWSAASKAHFERVTTPWDISYFGMTQASECLDMTKKLLRYFTGVKNLQLATNNFRFQRDYSSAPRYSLHNAESGSENSENILEILRMWLNPDLQRNLILFGSEPTRLREVMEDFAKEKPNLKSLLLEFEDDEEARKKA